MGAIYLSCLFFPTPVSYVADLGMKLEQGVVVRELKEGSQPHKHGVRLGDEICQVHTYVDFAAYTIYLCPIPSKGMLQYLSAKRLENVLA